VIRQMTVGFMVIFLIILGTAAFWLGKQLASEYAYENPQERHIDDVACIVENEYGIALWIKDNRPDKTEPLRWFTQSQPSLALHSADVIITFNEHEREFTLQEFVDLIFPEGKGE